MYGKNRYDEEKYEDLEFKWDNSPLEVKIIWGNGGNEMKRYIWRFLRTFLPQLPAFLSVLANAKPEYSAILIAVGGLVTAVDKYIRDNGLYPNKIEKVIG